MWVAIYPTRGPQVAVTSLQSIRAILSVADENGQWFRRRELGLPSPAVFQRIICEHLVQYVVHEFYLAKEMGQHVPVLHALPYSTNYVLLWRPRLQLN